MRPRRSGRLHGSLVLGLVLTGCAEPPDAGPSATPACDPDNGGLNLPEGFCAQVVADHLGAVRHLAVADGGRLYVSLRNRQLGLGGLLGLQDRDGDGRYEVIEAFGDELGLGVAVHGRTLYFAGDHRILRYRLPEPGAGVLPSGPPEVWVSGIGYAALEPGANALALDAAGEQVFIAAGTPSNACQPEDRQVGLPGIDPCPRLLAEAGIWRVPASAAPGPLARVGKPWATGWRLGLGLDWHPDLNALVTTGHGRDQLHSLWPAVHSAADEQRLPSEEVHIVAAGDDYGWPYCFFDAEAGRYQVAPEYAARPERSASCAGLAAPAGSLPAHSSPNDLVVYTGQQFPAAYRLGLFVALHGAYDPALAEVGRRVVFAAWDGQGFAPFTSFGEGRTAAGTLADGGGRYQPTGLALDHDGSLLVAESVQGKLWRIRWKGGESAPP